VVTLKTLGSAASIAERLSLLQRGDRQLQLSRRVGNVELTPQERTSGSSSAIYKLTDSIENVPRALPQQDPWPPRNSRRSRSTRSAARW
jgi:hypothetical protein